MSALPQTYPILPATPGRTEVVRKGKCSALKIVPQPAAQNGAKAIRARVENPVTDFGSIYHTYRRRIFYQCLNMLRNHAEAEDAAQEVFLQLFRKAHTFRGESRFSTWLHRLTTNCVLMEIRRKRNRWRESPLPEGPGIASDRNSAMDPSFDSFQDQSAPLFDQVSLGTAVSQLPSGFRKIFQLHDVEGYTHEEIATMLRIQTGTSKSQLHKARLRLRRLLESGRGSGAKVFMPV